jgi:hypothetical protein
LVLCFKTQQRNNNHLCGLEKIRRRYRDFVSRSLKWRTCSWYLTGRESRTKNLYQKGRLLTVNSTEKWWTEIWKDFDALGRIRLNQVTGSCCTIILLPTNQVVSCKEKHYYSLPSPYLPDLAPMDYFLLPTTADIQSMTSELKCVMAAEFNRGIQKLYDHVNRLQSWEGCML